MPILESQETALRKVLIDYLKGESLGSIKDKIEQQLKNNKNGYTLYHTITTYSDPNSPASTHPLTTEFLKHLKIESYDEEYQSLVNTPNLYRLLTRLKGRHGHLDKLIEIIDEATESTSWTYTILGIILGCAGVGTFLYFYPNIFWTIVDWFTVAIPKLLRWLALVFSKTRNVAFLGIIWQALILIWYWYDAFKFGPNASPDKVKSLLFKTLGISLNITANILLYFALGSLGPIAAVLFIASSLTDIIETIYILVVKYETPKIDLNKSVNALSITYKTKGMEPGELSLEERAHNTRNIYLRERDLNALWVKLAATALITISVTLWCVLEPGITLSICFLLLGLLIALGRDIIVKKINNHYAHDLQSALRVVYADETKVVAEMKNEFSNYVLDILHENKNYPPKVQQALRDRWDDIRTESPFNFELAKSKFDQSVRDITGTYQACQSMRMGSMSSGGIFSKTNEMQRNINRSDSQTQDALNVAMG